jgi:hypothetical protein
MNRRNFVKLAAYGTVGLAGLSRASNLLAALPTKRLQAGDMSYLGYFTVPQGTGATFSYGGMGLAMGPDGQSLYYGGHVYEESLGRISIPALNGTASIITQPTNIPGSVGGENVQELAGALFWNGRLLVTKRKRYSTLTYSGVVAVGGQNITGFSAFQPTQGVEGHFISGYMGVIPPEWRTAFGGPCFIGNGSMSIRGMCTNGPSFYVFNPDDVGRVSSVPVTHCQSYPLAHPLADPSVANDIWAASDPSGSYVFPDGTATMLYINRHGYGKPTYKSDTCGDTSGGDGNSPYRRQVTAFDVNDLLAVKNGQKNGYDVKPYAWWTLPGPTSACGELGGYANGSYCFTFDPATRRLYGVMDRGENRRVHVWSISGSTATTMPAPTAPTNLRINR